MAGFTAQLSDPGNISGSHATHDSTAGAIGSALGGVADILNVGLKYHAEERKEASLASLESTLFPVAQDFAKPQEAPKLIGEPRDLVGGPIAQDPAFQSSQDDLDKLRQAQKQGRMSRAEMYARSAVIVQAAIHENPRWADDIRKRAQDVLGFNPSAAMTGQQVEDQKAVEEQNKAIQTSQVQEAVKAGVLFLGPDGQPDMSRTAHAGMDIAAAQEKIKNHAALLDQQYKEAEIYKSQHPTLPRADMVAQEAQNVMGVLDPLYDTHISGAISRLIYNPNGIPFASAGGSKEDQQAAAFQAVGQVEAAWNNQVNNMLSKGQVSPEASEKIRKDFKERFDNWRTLAGTGLSSLEQNAANVKQLENVAKIGMAKAQPIISNLINTVGGMAIQPLIGNALIANSKLSGAVNNELSSLIGNKDVRPPTIPDTLLHTSDIASGTQTFAGLPNDLHRQTTAAVVSGALDEYSKRPNDLTDVELKAYSNMAKAVADHSVTATDPDELRAAAKRVSTPSALRTFDRYATDPNNNSQALGKSIIDLNLQSIQKNANELTTFDTAGASNFAQAKIGATNKAFTTEAFYNPSTGRVEAKTTNGEPIAVGYQSRINDLNQSLSAITHLSEYGDDRFKTLNEQQLKQAIIRGAGIGLKPGSEPVKMPGETAANKKESSNQVDKQTIDQHTIATMAIESGGNPNAVSSTGAVGTMQTMPNTLKNPGYGVEPAKDNSPAEMERVGRDYLGALMNHYNDATVAHIAYNWGPGHVDKWLKDGAQWSKLPDETQKYLGRIAVELFKQGRKS